MNKIYYLTVLLIIQILFTESVLANNATMSFKGTLIEPPNCIVNDGKIFDVNFGSERYSYIK